MPTFAIIAAATVAANLPAVLTALEARRLPASASVRIGMLVGLARRPLWRLAALGLPRFRGHLDTFGHGPEREVHDGKNEAAVPA